MCWETIVHTGADDQDAVRCSVVVCGSGLPISKCIFLCCCCWWLLGNCCEGASSGSELRHYVQAPLQRDEGSRKDYWTQEIPGTV